MAVTIDQVEGQVEPIAPTAEAAPDITGARPAVDPGQVKRSYTLIKERELRLHAD